MTDRGIFTAREPMWSVLLRVGAAPLVLGFAAGWVGLSWWWLLPLGVGWVILNLTAAAVIEAALGCAPAAPDRDPPRVDDLSRRNAEQSDTRARMADLQAEFDAWAHPVSAGYVELPGGGWYRGPDPASVVEELRAAGYPAPGAVADPDAMGRVRAALILRGYRPTGDGGWLPGADPGNPGSGGGLGVAGDQS